jgi:Phosphopantetheine attachment site
MSTTSSMSNAEIWTNLIGPARSIGRADKFFEMGGHSLLALQALRQIENKLGRETRPPRAFSGKPGGHRNAMPV